MNIRAESFVVAVAREVADLVAPDFGAAIVTIDPLCFDGKTKVSNLDQIFSCS